MSHKSPTTVIVTVAAALMVVAALSPQLIALSDALVPLIVVIGVVALVLRLVWSHTNRW
jgi:protein-S-isoprenylcysteine O-methyltransferase Ste14